MSRKSLVMWVAITLCGCAAPRSITTSVTIPHPAHASVIAAATQIETSDEGADDDAQLVHGSLVDRAALSSVDDEELCFQVARWSHDNDDQRADLGNFVISLTATDADESAVPRTRSDPQVTFLARWEVSRQRQPSYWEPTFQAAGMEIVPYSGSDLCFTNDGLITDETRRLRLVLKLDGVEHRFEWELDPVGAYPPGAIAQAQTLVIHPPSATWQRGNQAGARRVASRRPAQFTGGGLGVRRPAVDVAPVASGADDASRVARARASFQRGVEYASRREWDAALSAFNESRAHYDRARTLFNVAVALDRLERGPECMVAIETLLVRTDVDAADRTEAEGLRRRWRARLGVLILNVNPPAAEVTVDGVPPTRVGPRIWLNPGSHLVWLSAPGRTPVERRVRIGAGQEQQLAVAL